MFQGAGAANRGTIFATFTVTDYAVNRKSARHRVGIWPTDRKHPRGHHPVGGSSAENERSKQPSVAMMSAYAASAAATTICSTEAYWEKEVPLEPHSPISHRAQ
jgi:hypothetical protein